MSDFLSSFLCHFTKLIAAIECTYAIVAASKWSFLLGPKWFSTHFGSSLRINSN
jgi:hypothetical protein